MSKSEQPVIIIRRKKKGGHGGHHGGAWKVAYADFVTAMMSFFLLLWLLNTTTSDQRKGLADYFAPAGVSKAEGGAGGLLAGQSFSKVGARMSDKSPAGLEDRVMPPDEAGAGGEEEAGVKTAEQRLEEKLARAVAAAAAEEQAAHESMAGGMLAEAVAAAEAIKREESLFRETEGVLKEALATSAEFKDLAQSLLIDRTPEGLRIQITDRDKFSLFPSGSSVPYERGRDLLRLIGRVVARLPNAISITGHTDSSPFPAGSRRSNWDLSTDRANTSRSEIMAGGVPDARIARVAGLADRDSLVKDNPLDSRNRRISIVLLRKTPSFQPSAPAGPSSAGAAPPPSEPAPAAPPLRR